MFIHSAAVISFQILHILYTVFISKVPLLILEVKLVIPFVINVSGVQVMQNKSKKFYFTFRHDVKRIPAKMEELVRPK